jgi:iron complex transport system substrate-binding protein
VAKAAASRTAFRVWLYLCSSVFICGPFALIAAAAAISVVDDLGRKVELKAPATRIVTLAPFLTELTFSAGAGERIVGVSAYSDYPEAAKKLPQVATAISLALEPLLALKPDLVLAWRDTIRAEDIARLEGFHIAVFVAQARSLEDVPRLLGSIGTLTGRDVSGLSQDYRERLGRLRSAHASLPRTPVFLEIWHRPLTTIAGSHWMNEALEVCGATNVFQDLPTVAPVVSWEEIYARDPRVVVGAGSGTGAAEFRANWKLRESLAAAQAGRLVYLDPDTIQRPTLRLADGVTQLCDGLDRVR